MKTALTCVQTRFNQKVKHYYTDLAHDIELLTRFPENKFIYFLRDCGSHIVFLGKGINKEGYNKDLFNQLFQMNDHYYFWSGKAMSKVTKVKAYSLAEKNEPIFFGM